MPKTAELSESTRKSIIQLHRDGLGYRKISSVLNIPISTVCDTVRRWKAFHLSTSLPRSGRPTKISDRTARSLIRKVQNNPRLTRSELQKDLQSSGTNVCKNTIRTVH
jgi:transposase